MQNWLFDEGGKPSSPRSTPEIQSLIAAGKISADQLVWREGMSNWMPAQSFAELIPPGVVLPPPLPPVALAYAMHSPPIGSDATMRMLLPVGRSGWAIAAGYLGLFALIPIFAPVALIVSLVALRDLKKHPESHGKGRAIFGLVMGGLLTIGWIILLAAAVFSH